MTLLNPRRFYVVDKTGYIAGPYPLRKYADDELYLHKERRIRYKEPVNGLKIVSEEVKLFKPEKKRRRKK